MSLAGFYNICLSYITRFLVVVTLNLVNQLVQLCLSTSKCFSKHRNSQAFCCCILHITHSYPICQVCFYAAVLVNHAKSITINITCQVSSWVLTPFFSELTQVYYSFQVSMKGGFSLVIMLISLFCKLNEYVSAIDRLPMIT